MKITPHGYKHVVVASILMLLLAAGAFAASMIVCRWIGILLILPTIVYFWLLWFFRDPDMRIPDGKGLFISPADGIVADITPVGADSELGCEGVRIGVFMNIFSIHVNRMPCDGRIEDVTHHAGEFLDVRLTEAYERNESTTIRLVHTFNGTEYPVVVRQIAGLVARRIITCLRPGQELVRGERFGMIRFGSRLELMLPAPLVGNVAVEAGDQARVGETVLAVAGSIGEDR